MAVAGERPDDLIHAIRQGHLVVETTTGGPTEPILAPDEDDDSGSASDDSGAPLLLDCELWPIDCELR